MLKILSILLGTQLLLAVPFHLFQPELLLQLQKLLPLLPFPQLLQLKQLQLLLLLQQELLLMLLLLLLLEPRRLHVSMHAGRGSRRLAIVRRGAAVPDVPELRLLQNLRLCRGVVLESLSSERLAHLGLDLFQRTHPMCLIGAKTKGNGLLAHRHRLSISLGAKRRKGTRLSELVMLDVARSRGRCSTIRPGQCREGRLAVPYRLQIVRGSS